MLDAYSKCSFSITMKMHSTILSFACGTPSIHLYYDQKSIEFMNIVPYGIKGNSIFETNYRWCKKAIDDMILNNEEYSSFLKDIKQEEQKEFDSLMDNLCNILKTTN
jgi:polysaccharide pyruvyl transferase WcaK-like protein